MALSTRLLSRSRQFDDLQECYLQKRRLYGNQVTKQEQRSGSLLRIEGYSAGLENFQSLLTTFTRYSRLRVIAELRHGDLFQSANIVSRFDQPNPSLLSQNKRSKAEPTSKSLQSYITVQEICRPAAWHKFGSPDADETEDDAGSYFISVVCWKSDSPTVLTANSQGTIKVLVLAA